MVIPVDERGYVSGSILRCRGGISPFVFPVKPAAVQDLPGLIAALPDFFMELKIFPEKSVQ